MAEMSIRFNAEAFDEMCREALDQNDEAMAQIYALSGLQRVLRPGDIGTVLTDFTPE